MQRAENIASSQNAREKRREEIIYQPSEVAAVLVEEEKRKLSSKVSVQTHIRTYV